MDLNLRVDTAIGKTRVWNKRNGAFVTSIMSSPPKWAACCALSILVALYVVGAVGNGSLRHEVQTLPLR